MKDVLSIAIPNLLVLIGWLVIYRQTISIKRRDDLEGIVRKSCELIEKIYSDAIAYFSDDEILPIGHESAEIRSTSLLLTHYLMLLRERGVKKSIGPYLISFRKSCMGGFFESTRKNEQSGLPNWKSDLANSKSELIFRINQSFLEWCHPKMGKSKIYNS